MNLARFFKAGKARNQIIITSRQRRLNGFTSDVQPSLTRRNSLCDNFRALKDTAKLKLPLRGKYRQTLQIDERVTLHRY
jgi:hypothetical protein